MTTDKTGAQTTVTQEADRFTITVEGQPVGFTQFADRDGQRVFFHTEVDGDFGGRGLATILVGEALATTQDADLRIVPVCELVAAHVDKHAEFSDSVDQPTPEINAWLKSATWPWHSETRKVLRTGCGRWAARTRSDPCWSSRFS